MKTITLKLEPTSLKMPVISLRIAAKTHYFVIDTGAETSHFSTEFLEKDFVSKYTLMNSHCVGAGGKEQTVIVQARFNILEKAINHFAIAKSVNGLAAFAGFPISGLIGEDILSQFYSVEICYARGVIKFNL